MDFHQHQKLLILGHLIKFHSNVEELVEDMQYLITLLLVCLLKETTLIKHGKEITMFCFN